MTVTAFNVAVNAVIVYCFIDIIIPSLAVFIDSAAKSVSVAHKIVVFIGSEYLRAIKEGDKKSCQRQPWDDMFFT